MPVFINGQKLTVVDNVRILGVTISNDFSWAELVKGIRTKLNGRLDILWRLGYILNMTC